MSSPRPSSPPRLAGCVRPVAGLADGERARLLALMDRHFGGVSACAFAADLDEKEEVVLLHDEAKRIQGFSTVVRIEAEAEGQPFTAFFSGDTVVDRAHWGTPALPQTWSRHVFAWARAHPDRPTVWFLLAGGYKTYRFLPTFFRRFTPAPNDASTPWERAALDRLARQRYGARYARGVVRLAHPTPTRPGLADVTERRLRDPHVAFFARRNPGWAQGDELACLTRIHPDNLTAAGRRMVGPALAAPLP